MSVVRIFLAYLAAWRDTSRSAVAVEAVWTTLHRAWTPSSTETAVNHGLEASGGLVRGSRFVRTTAEITRPVARTMRQAADRANLMRLAGQTGAALRSSWLYRWFTAEPEPEIIVIDLGETVSVGPIIAHLDRLIRGLVPAGHRSAVVGTAETIHQSLTSGPVRAVSIILGGAVLTNLIIILTVGEPTQTGVFVRIALLGVAALGTRVGITWDDLVETRLIQLVIAALEPPEPPKE